MHTDQCASLIAPSAQAARRRILHAAARETVRPHYTPDGAWVGGFRTPGVMVRCWHLLAFFSGDAIDIALANAILSATEIDTNAFMCYYAYLLLRLHEERMTPRSREVIADAIALNREHVIRHLFRYTENAGLLNAFALLEAARREENPRLAACAVERLEIFAHGIAHNGMTQEFLSINYLPVTLRGLSQIAEYADAPAREIACAAEARLWACLADFWHPELGHIAGPSGRSYINDSMAASSNLRGMIWGALGDGATISPIDIGLFATPPTCAVKSHNATENGGEMSWMTCTDYHPDAETAARFYQRALPATVQATVTLPNWRTLEPVAMSVDAERLGGWRSETQAYVPSSLLYPGGAARIQSYLAPGYGLGTASKSIYTQCDFLFGIWRRQPTVMSPADERTLFTRYVVNDALEEKLGPARFAVLLPEQGRGGALSNGPLAVAWYRPGEEVLNGITALRTCVVLPTWYNEPEEIWLGEQPGATVSAKPAWTCLRDGDTYIGLYPLNLSDHGREHAVSVARVGRFLTVQFPNYAGPARDFPPSLLRQTAGGVVCCLGTRAEWGDFANFRRACTAAEVDDVLYESHRRLRVTWAGRALELIYEMQTEDLLWSKADDRFLD